MPVNRLDLILVQIAETRNRSVRAGPGAGRPAPHGRWGWGGLSSLLSRAGSQRSPRASVIRPGEPWCSRDSDVCPGGFLVLLRWGWGGGGRGWSTPASPRSGLSRSCSSGPPVTAPRTCDIAPHSRRTGGPRHCDQQCWCRARAAPFTAPPHPVCFAERSSQRATRLNVHQSDAPRPVPVPFLPQRPGPGLPGPSRGAGPDGQRGRTVCLAGAALLARFPPRSPDRTERTQRLTASWRLHKPPQSSELARHVCRGRRGAQSGAPAGPSAGRRAPGKSARNNGTKLTRAHACQ